jgi:multiple sugar transport system substrate-binding protein
MLWLQPRRWVKGIWIGGLLISMLSACGQSSGEDATQSQGTDEPAQTAKVSQEPVEMVFYNASNPNFTLDSFMESNEGIRITKKFPNVKIDVMATGKGTQIGDLVASGQPMDIIICSVFSFPEMIKLGLQYDMSGLIKQNKYDMSRFEPTTIEFVKQLGDGGIFGFPVVSTPTALFYNKDLFDKFGTPYPKDGMTWDEAYELAKKVTRTDGDVQYHGFVTRYPYMFNVNQLALSYYDTKTNKVDVTSDKFRLFVNNFTRFGRIPGNGKLTSDMFIKDRTVAMMAYQLGSWDNLNWDAASLPSFKEAMGVGPQAYSTYWNISSTSKHKEQAFAILSDLTSDEFQLSISKKGSLPVVTTPAVIKAFGQEADGSNGSHNLKGKHVEAFLYAKRADPTHVTIYDDLVAKRMRKVYEDIANGKVDAVTALRDVQEEAQKDADAARQ